MLYSVWRLVLHHERDRSQLAWDLTVKNERIALGWGHVGDLSTLSFATDRQLSQLVEEQYPDLRNAKTAGPSLRRFSEGVREGDLVILSSSAGHPRRPGVVQVTGPYRFRRGGEPELGDYFHHRPAHQWTEISADDLWEAAGAAPAAGQSIRMPLVRLQRQVDI
jgi:predicted Mrr-cat superfamily restriction endonuclease